MGYSKKSKAIILMSILLVVAVISGTVVLGGYVYKPKPEDTNTEIAASNNRIDELLSQIMSSPKESSNPGDYIAAHQEEYNAIIEMDTEALTYLFAEFNQSVERTGLKGHIMESLCRDILGSEDIKYASTSPEDWYHTYSAYIRSILEKNSFEFVKKNYPKGSILLDGYDITGDFLKQRGLTITINSGASEDIQLPANFKYVKDGVKIGELLKQRNELSKQNNLDFSKYMDQKVKMYTYGISDLSSAEQTILTKVNYEVVFLLDEKNNIIGYWVDPGIENSGQNRPDFNVLLSLSTRIPSKQL